MTSADPAVAALIAGLTANGMDHGISPDLARHVLAVLDAARFAVVPLPQAEPLRTSPAGVRSAQFGHVVASSYPNGGGWLVSEINGIGTWNDSDAEAAIGAVTGVLAAIRWAQHEAAKDARSATSKCCSLGIGGLVCTEPRLHKGDHAADGYTWAQVQR